jgi:hypothetical protein
LSVNSKIEFAAIPSIEAGEIEPARAEVEQSKTTDITSWIARAFIILLALGTAWHTWAHWGDFQIDNGREIYVPAAILQGKLLFRDLWYMYGPLAPYVQALLFRIFGVHLLVLYLFGLTLTIGSALLTFEIARKFDLGPAASVLPSIFFILEAFYPFIFNFVFPYSYAASLGSFLGLACLYFAVIYSSGMRPVHLGMAALFGAFALLTKQEFGVACLALVGFLAVVPPLIQRSVREFAQNLAICVAGLSPAIAGYGWFTWKLSARLIFFENWISTPGTYFMRTFSKRTMATQGFRFNPNELIPAVVMAALTILLWYLLGYLNALAVKKRRLQPRFAVMVGLLDILTAVMIILHARGPANLLYIFLAQSIFPKGIIFLGLFFIGEAVWKLWRNPAFSSALPEAALGIYATLVSVRVMMELAPSVDNYGVFFNVPIFLVFIILVVKAVRRGSSSLEPRSSNVLVAYLMGAEAVLLCITLFPNPRRLPVPLKTDLGTFYTKADVAVLFPQIISFMKSHTKNGKDILVVPEPPSLYAFAGMQAPTRWYSLTPGVVDPAQEVEFIRQAEASDVRYVLISNRAVSEYGVAPFGFGYNQSIYQWITANFRQVGRFGPLRDSFPDVYVVDIFERKGLEAGK